MAKKDHDQRVTKDDELELKYFVDSALDLRAIYDHLKSKYKRHEEPYHSNPKSFYYDVVVTDENGEVTGHMLRDAKLSLRTRGTSGRGRPQISIKTDGEPTPEGVIDRKEFERYISTEDFDLNNISDASFNVIARTVLDAEAEAVDGDDNDLVQRFRDAGRELTNDMKLDDPDEFTQTVLKVRDILEDNDLVQIFTTDAQRSAISVETEINGKVAIFEIALDDCQFLHRDLESRPYIETLMGKTFEVEVEFKLEGSDPSLTKDEVSKAAAKISRDLKTVAPSMELNTQSKAQVGFEFLEAFDKQAAWARNRNDMMTRKSTNDNKPAATPIRKKRRLYGLG